MKNEPASRTTALLDITAVAERLGVSVHHVRRLVAERRMPYLEWGHLLRFDPEDLQQWIDAARVDSDALPSHTHIGRHRGPAVGTRSFGGPPVRPHTQGGRR